MQDEVLKAWVDSTPWFSIQDLNESSMTKNGYLLADIYVRKPGGEHYWPISPVWLNTQGIAFAIMSRMPLLVVPVLWRPHEKCLGRNIFKDCTCYSAHILGTPKKEE